METIRGPLTSRNHSSLSLALQSITNQSEMYTQEISPMSWGHSWETWLYFVLNSVPFSTLLSMKDINLPWHHYGPWVRAQGGTLVSLLLTERSDFTWDTSDMVTVPEPMSCVVFLMTQPRAWEGATDINHHGRKNGITSSVVSVPRLKWVNRSRYFQVNLWHISSNSLLSCTSQHNCRHLSHLLFVLPSFSVASFIKSKMVPIGPIYKNVKTEKA